ncbi:MAG TPA: hypothetical protein VMY88_00440 [Acidimicrobiales bacterium]|nr:hypothetical protein [Acidimicrobiales bacterium]
MIAAPACTWTRRLTVATLVSLAALMAPTLATPSTAAAAPRLAFAMDGQVRVVDADGTDEHPVAWTGDGTRPLTWHYIAEPSWSPDGNRIAFGDSYGALYSPVSAELRIARADNKSDELVLTLPLAGVIQHVRWSPAGDKLAFVLWTPNPPVAVATWTWLGSRWDIYVVNVDGSGLRPLAPVHASMSTSFDFSPDGKQIAFVTDQEGVAGVFTIPVDAPALPTRITPRDVSVEFPRWSPDGSRIAFIGNSLTPSELLDWPRLWTIKTDGTDLTPVDAWTYHPPTWSPDSRTLAFACANACGIGSIGIDGTRRRDLTSGLARDNWPVWSRHGQIAFVREEGGPVCCTTTLWVMDADGSHPHRASAAGSVTFAIAWSP